MNTDSKSCLLAASVLALVGGSSHAVVSVYTADADTLHLWHLDESSSPAQPASGVSGSFDLIPANSGTPVGASATLGNPGFAGFGTSGSTAPADSSEIGSGGTIPLSSLVAPDGAFTYEAMINISDTAGIQMIFTMENNGGRTDRPFQWRIFGGDLQFLNIAGGSGVQTLAATIPTTGANAFVANEWFHVAVTYDGAEGTAGNFNFYWTRVDQSVTEASLLASGQMNNDLTGSDSRFVVGNTGRDAFSNPVNNLEGRVDEVRVSSIARGADDFIFAVPEPTASLLLGLGSLGLLRRRR